MSNITIIPPVLHRIILPPEDEVPQPPNEVLSSSSDEDERTTVEPETSPNDFERKLTGNGFKVEPDYEVCNHPHTHTLFYQGCTCCESDEITSPYSNFHQKNFIDITSTVIPWRKGDYCESCIDGRIGVLFCGGHYNNLRVFHGDIDISCDYGNCTIKELNPNELVYAEIIHDWYTDEFSKIIEDQFEKNGNTKLSITDMDMSGEDTMEIFFDVIHDNDLTSFETLELRSCSLKSDQVLEWFVIEELSEYWPALKVLDLTGNDISEIPPEYRNSPFTIKI